MDIDQHGRLLINNWFAPLWITSAVSFDNQWNWLQCYYPCWINVGWCILNNIIVWYQQTHIAHSCYLSRRHDHSQSCFLPFVFPKTLYFSAIYTLTLRRTKPVNIVRIWECSRISNSLYSLDSLFAIQYEYELDILDLVTNNCAQNRFIFSTFNGFMNVYKQSWELSPVGCCEDVDELNRLIN